MSLEKGTLSTQRKGQWGPEATLSGPTARSFSRVPSGAGLPGKTQMKYCMGHNYTKLEA